MLTKYFFSLNLFEFRLHVWYTVAATAITSTVFDQYIWLESIHHHRCISLSYDSYLPASRHSQRNQVITSMKCCVQYRANPMSNTLRTPILNQPSEWINIFDFLNNFAVFSAASSLLLHRYQNWLRAQNFLDSIGIDSCPVTLIGGRIFGADIRYEVLS